MITKTKPARTDVWVTTHVRERFYGSGTPTVQSWTGMTNMNYGAQTITYSEGPKRIAGHCNWKTCHHLGSERVYEGDSYSARSSSIAKNPGAPSQRYRVDGFIPSSVSGLVYPSAPVMPSLDLQALANEMYGDLAGRVDSSFLSLESLAGLVSGNSFFKTVGGVARATDKFAKAVRQLRKLSRRFGKRTSLINMWSKSKDLVRELIGYELGYRFAFKATLSDIVEAVDAATGFQMDVQRLAYRQDKRVLMYTKNAQDTASNKSTISGTTFLSKCRQRIGSSPNVFDSPPSDAPPVTLSSVANATARLYTWARVRYPREYITAKRVLQSRFGLDKPLSTLWAIVPCSFVIDYLVKVQDQCEAWDNALNEYAVAVDIYDAWVLKTETRYRAIDWPGIVTSWDSGTKIQTREYPAIAARLTDQKSFSRYPVSVSDIMSTVGSLIRSDDERWIQRVGTGLELLVSRRL